MTPLFWKNPLRFAVMALSFPVWFAPSLRAGVERRAWTVDGVEREAIVYTPDGTPRPATRPDHPPTEKSSSRPLVFAFHGHGGSMAQAMRSLSIHQSWPEAVCVWPQGLPTPGKLTDPEGKRNGWQMGVGDLENRDLHFYDVMLKSFLAEGGVIDSKRVFALGHSNGGAFTYLLWAERGDTLAAVGPSGAVAAKTLPKLRRNPKPMIAIAGRNDPLVKYEWQDRMIQALLRSNGCSPAFLKNGLTHHSSTTQTPVRTLIHPNGHALPSDAVGEIAKFFQSLTSSPPSPLKSSAGAPVPTAPRKRANVE